MIRFLFLLVVFCLGLVAAGLWFGQMHHLRMAAPQALPGWTGALPDDAGLRRGRVPVPAQGVWPPVEVSWQAAAPGLDGLRWRVQVTGDGIDLAGDLTVSYWPDTARLSGVTGTLALDRVSGGQVDLQGLLALRRGAVEARGLLQAPVLRGDVAGELRAVRAGGAEFGAGPVTAVLQEDGAWRAEARLDGGVSAVDAGLDGVLARRTATLEVTVADDRGLPTALRDLLSRTGEAEGDGWRVTAEIPVY